MPNLLHDRILRATGDAVQFRLVPVDATRTANAIADKHEAKGLARQLIGEAVSAALLLASGLKAAGTVQLRFSLSGDLSRLAADATPFGLARAMIPREEIVRTAGFEPVFLPRMLTVRKLDAEGNRLSEGVVEMIAPDISASVTHYLHQSEQGKFFLRVGAQCDATGAVLTHAGGFLIEGFPGLADKDWKTLETLAQKLDPAAFANPDAPGMDLEALFAAFAGSFPSHVHREFAVDSFCPCSEEGVLRALSSLGREGLESLYLEGNDAELFCEFCRRRYLIGPDRIRELMEEAEFADPPEAAGPGEPEDAEFGEPELPEDPEEPENLEP